MAKNGAARDKKKTCFVVMGFGEKTDYQSSPARLLDLNKAYEHIIEPAVKQSGVECIRADKIIHSTVIDKPMYEQLLEADLVIADLSTSNANALYELGVRHALRPHTTIVMAEKGFSFPFDLNHVSILKYEHLGKEIGYGEVVRARTALKKKISAVISRNETDSPVFLFLPKLLGKGARVAPAAPMAAKQDARSFAELMDSLRQAKAAVKEPEDWLVVVELASRLKKLQPSDPFVIQQLALATYKSKHPGALQALRKAKGILQALGPDTSCDAETVGLCGAIHKRLWEIGGGRTDLDTSIRAYARGYFIKNDHYNGINFAFLLNVRAALSKGEEAVADRVLARRIRVEVVKLCDAAAPKGAQKRDRGPGSAEDLFWVNASRVEALLGLGRVADSNALKKKILAAKPAPQPWMVDTLNEQLGKLMALKP